MEWKFIFGRVDIRSYLESSSNPNRRLNSFSESLNADYRHYEERFARVILTGEFCLLTGEISSIET
jgi:hypothetical protein